jgi:aminoglycoside phosphotransferase (APT) family kinase protein
VLSYEAGQSVVKATAQDPAAVLSALGRALAALHTTPVAVEGTTSAAGVLNGLHQKIADLSARFPGQRDSLRQMFNLLERRTPWSAAPAFLHGDLGPSQLLWQQGRIVMLDFDRCTRGDPASDLGRLLAQLRRLTLRKPGKLPEFTLLRRGILEEYQRCLPPDPGLPERVAWYEQVTLLQKIHFLVSDTTRHSEAESMQLRQAEATCLLGALAPLVQLTEPPPVVGCAAQL